MSADHNTNCVLSLIQQQCPRTCSLWK